VSLFLLCGSLHLRSQEAPFYDHGELVGQESTMWQLELAAQMKIGALTILTLIVAVFAVRKAATTDNTAEWADSHPAVASACHLYSAAPSHSLLCLASSLFFLRVSSV